jgi:molybdopterin converting factor small subunit
MATVFIPAAIADLADGLEQIEAAGSTVGEVIDNLLAAAPALRERLLDGDSLKSNLAVAIDGEIGALGMRESVEPDSEIHFVAAISGGVAR